MPGTVVGAKVRKVLRGGHVHVVLPNGLKGSVSRDHLPSTSGGVSVPEAKKAKLVKKRNETPLKEGSSIRVLITAVDDVGSLLKLSALDVLVNLVDCPARMAFQDYDVGSKFTGKVVATGSRGSILFEPQTRTKHQPKILARRTQLDVPEKCESDVIRKKYSVGSEHACRVLSHRIFDHTIQVSCRKEILKAKVMTFKDAMPGQLLTCSVLRARAIQPNRGVLVRVIGTDNQKNKTNVALGLVKGPGLAQWTHIGVAASANNLHLPLSGTKLKCRVLSHDAKHERVILTCKPALVNCPLVPITEIHSSLVGKLATGILVMLQPTGALVLFYNGVKAWITAKDLVSVDSAPSVGHPVTVRVKNVDVQSGRMTVTCVEQSDAPTPHVQKSEADDTCPTVYLPHGGRVSSIGVSKTFGRYCTLQDSQAASTCGGLLQLPMTYISDSLAPCENSQPKVDEIVKPLVIVHKQPTGGAIVSSSPLLCSWFEGTLCGESGDSYGLGYTLGALEQGRLVCGVVANTHADYGVFVSLPTVEESAISGLAPYSCVDGGKDTSLRKGSIVIAKLKQVDLENRKVSLQLRARYCFPPNMAPINLGIFILRSVLKERIRMHALNGSAPKIGSILTIKVTSFGDDGATCQIVGENRHAIAVLAQCQNPADTIEVGTQMPCRVLDVHSDGVVEVSLNKTLVGKGNQECGRPKFATGHRLKVMIADVKSDYLLAFERLSGSKFCSTASQPIYLPSRLHPNESPPTAGRFEIGKLVTVILMEHVDPVGWLASAETDEQTLTVFAEKNTNKTSAESQKTAVLDRRGVSKLVPPGKICRATVTGEIVQSDNLCRYAEVHFSRLIVAGRIHASELPEEYLKRDKPLDEFVVENAGKIVKLRVISARRVHKAVHAESTGRMQRSLGERVIDCTMNDRKMAIVKVNKRNKLDYEPRLRHGDLVDGFVCRVDKHKLTLDISPYWRGTLRSLDVTSADRHLASNLAKRFALGQLVTNARVIGVNKQKRMIQLTTVGLEDMQISADVPALARVTSTDPSLPHSSTFVQLELRGHATAFMRAVDVCDNFGQLQSIINTGKFAVGSHLLVVPVVAVGEKKHQWVVSARHSLLPTKQHRTDTDSDHTEIVDPYFKTAGELPTETNGVVRGFVKRVSEQHGVFVALGAQVDGRVPYDCMKWGRDVIVAYLRPGDLVSASVRRVSGDKVHLSMLPAHVGALAHKANSALIQLRQNVKVEVKQEEDISFEAVLSRKKRLSINDDENSEKKSDAKSFPKKQRTAPLPDPGFDFSAQSEFAPEKLASVGLAVADTHKRIKSAKIKSDADSASAAAEFDKLLMTSPASSELWLRYVAFFAGNGDIEKARATVQRAFGAITADADRQAIWLAWLNLEIVYGDDDSTADTLKQALDACDRFTVYTHMLKAYLNAGKIEPSLSLCEEMLRKLRHDTSTDPVRLWSSVGRHMMQCGAADRCRATMQRALKSADEDKSMHVQLAVKFAQIEFEEPGGDVERGKTIMESVMQSRPKRTDLWCDYFTLLAKHCSMDSARFVMRRATALAQSSGGQHKVRALCNRWIEAERKCGDEQGFKEVQELLAILGPGEV